MYIDQQAQYPPASTPSPNFQRPAGGASHAPFYMAGAEVPPHGGAPPSQQQHQQQPPQAQQYPPRDPGQRAPSAGKQPGPIRGTSPPPAAVQYANYGAPSGAPRPQSQYGGPQELSTSVYDSPIAPHNPHSAATYSSSVYSAGDPYAAASPVAGGPANNGLHGGGAPSAPSGLAPSAPSVPSSPADHRQSSYQPYTTYSAQQASAPSYGGDRYGSSNDGPHPPPPTSQAPRPPNQQQQQQQRPGNIMTPPPPHPGVQAIYDARQSLPSRNGPEVNSSQFKAYVPTGAGAGPSAPMMDEGPSAPGDYYRTAAY